MRTSQSAAPMSMPDGPDRAAIDRLARQATTHCLTGCAIGEVVGMVVSGVAGLGSGASIGVSIVLAFVFGYGLTVWPLISSGMSAGAAGRLAIASDTVSITVMETIDNLTVLVVPGAMAAGLGDLLFWASLAGGFALAWVITYPVNRWLIRRGRGHAVVHRAHDG